MQNKIYIPKNKYGIKEGYYTPKEIENIYFSGNDEVKQFILDMLED